METQDLNRGVKIYHKNHDYTISEFTYIRRDGTSYVVEDSFSVVHRLSYLQISSYNFSKRMLLTEIEEELRNMIDNIHSQLKEMNIKFNPVEPFNVVYKRPSSFHNVPVYQYDKNTGRYIQGFGSMVEAIESVGKDKKKASNITAVCAGRQVSVYGFKWSYEKRKTY